MNSFLTEKQFKALIISVIATVLGYLVFALWSGWQEVLDALSRIGFVGIIIALILSLLNYGLRFIRWQMYLNTMGYLIPNWQSLKIYLAGFALTTTPGKAGEALRGVLLKPLGVSWKSCLAALLSERISDLLAVVILALFGLFTIPSARGIVLFSIIFLVIILAILANKSFLEKHYQEIEENTKFKKLIKNILGILLEARRCQNPKLFTITLFLSLIAWAAEAFAFYLMLKYMGLNFSLSFAIFVYAFSTLAGSLSFLPGGLGGVEAVMFGLLVLKGVSNADAVALTVLLRLVTLWFAVIIGIFSLWKLSFNLKIKDNKV